MKICILTHGRCGSTALLLSLCSHSKIKPCKSIEPFCTHSSMFSYYHDFILENFGFDYHNQPIINTDHLKILQGPKYIDHIYENENIIKITNYFIHPEFRLYLKNHPEIKIILLCRKNLLSLIISYFVVGRLSDGKPMECTLNLEHACNFLDEIISTERLLSAIFNDRLIKVYYEDMCFRWECEIVRMQQFLELPIEFLQLPTHTITKRPQFSEILQNHDIIPKLQQKYGHETIFLEGEKF